jgi:MYXO-CTERM domain-containing protein
MGLRMPRIVPVTLKRHSWRSALCTLALASVGVFVAGPARGGIPTGVPPTQLVVPPMIQSSGHAGDPLIAAGYLDVTLYGADPSGKTDSTTALQNAINDGIAYYMTVYVPSGAYVVSDTLHGDQTLGSPGCAPYAASGTTYVYGAFQAPSLVGPAAGPRPIIQLADASAGFDSASSPKPVIHMYNDGILSNGMLGAEYQGNPQYNTKSYAADCFMFGVIRDIDLSLGSGNPGAVGIQFYAAQYSYLENISIDATGAYAGFQGTSDTEAWVNLSVTGGTYGLMFDDGGNDNTLVGLTLKGQTVAGLYNIGSGGGTTVVGFDIEETSAVAVTVGDALYAGSSSGPQSALVALIDGFLSSTGQPAITNVDGIDLYLSNVYAKAPSVLIQTSGSTTVPASGGVDAIEEYSHTDTGTVGAGATYAPQTSVNVIDGTTGTNDVVSMSATVASYPSDLLLRHLPGQTPWIADNGVAWATIYGADPTGKKDSTAAIQSAIDASDDVFLPRGDYTISRTLNLKPNTRIFGVPGQRTRFMAPYWVPTDGDFHPMISTADSATGKTYVGDIWFMLDVYPSTSDANPQYDQTYVTAMDWQTGRSSISHQVNVNIQYARGPDFTSAPRKLLHVMNHGGGRWYGTQMQLCCNGSQRDGSDGFRTIMMDETTAPLTIYGSNPEHQSLPNPFYEYSSASNVRVLGLKSEIVALADVTSSNNLMFAGIVPHGQANISLTGTTNVTMANMSYYSGPANNANVVYITDDNATYTYNDAYSLFRFGDFEANCSAPGQPVCTGTAEPFPRCGDGVCDGAEDTENCPVDCGGGGGEAGDRDAGALGDATRPPSQADGGNSDGAADRAMGSGGGDGGCSCTTAARYAHGGAGLAAIALALAFVARRRRALAV